MGLGGATLRECIVSGRSMPRPGITARERTGAGAEGRVGGAGKAHQRVYSTPATYMHGSGWRGQSGLAGVVRFAYSGRRGTIDICRLAKVVY